MTWIQPIILGASRSSFINLTIPGRPYERALSDLDVLAIVENDPDSTDPEPGSNSLQWWRRRESNSGRKSLTFNDFVFHV